MSSIITEYNEQHGLYRDFTKKLEGLLTELLKQNNIRVHSITARVKERSSLEGKISRSMGKYTHLSDITDIVGIRIITYYSDEVDAIANIVEKEFRLDNDNSVDKRDLLDPDRFGYLSLHYVVGLPDKRTELAEYSRFKPLKAEVQIRSILQHTWAEIEHDMGYKSKHAIPKEIRRRFSRLAGLLELADLEFAKIRESVQQYENQVPQQIHDAPAQVEIDKTSLTSYINTSELVQSLDYQIVKIARSEPTPDEQFIGMMVDRLHYFELRTIEDVNAALEEHREMILSFARQIFAFREPPLMIGVGVCLLYLCYILIGRTQSTNKVIEFLKSAHLAEGMQEVIAQEILTYYSQVAPH